MEPLDYRQNAQLSSVERAERLRSQRGVEAQRQRIRETKGAARVDNRKPARGGGKSASSAPMSDAATGEVSPRQVPSPDNDESRGAGVDQTPAPAGSNGRAAEMPSARRIPRRPGVGGRAPRSAQFGPRHATERLLQRLGEPIERITGAHGVKTQIWKVDAAPWLEPDFFLDVSELPAGAEREVGEEERRVSAGERPAGIIVARLSGREQQNGETVMSQVLDCWEMARSNQLRVSHIVVSTDCKSEVKFEEREDFSFVLRQADLGACEWIAFRSADRVARRVGVAFTLYEELRRAGVELWLWEENRALDFDADADSFILAIRQTFSQSERNHIVKKLDKAKRERFIDAGYGWPSAIRFGFKREKDRSLVVDEEQWPTIKFIHYGYETAEHGEKRGYHALHLMLRDMGVDLSPERIRTILQDPIYVDGSYVVNDGGVPVAQRPIVLADPIPLDLFQRNQQRLACQKGPHKATPLGAFCLNGIPVVHAPCQDWVHEKTGEKPLLKGRNWKSKGRRSYRHVPGRPDCCARYTIEQSELEGPIMRALLDLADDPELQGAWAAAARAEAAPETAVFDQATVARLSAELRNLESEQERLLAEVVAETARGGASGGDGGGIAAEVKYRVIDELEKQTKIVRNKLHHAERERVDASDGRGGEASDELRGTSSEELRAALAEICTVEVPDDDRMKLKRMAVVECCLSKVVVSDNEDGSMTLELHGPLAPASALTAGVALPVSPIDAAAHVLESHLLDKELADEGVEIPEQALKGERASQLGALRPTKFRATGKSLLARSYDKHVPSRERERASRELKRFDSRWPQRLSRRRGHRAPCFIGRLHLGQRSGSSGWVEAQCIRAIQELSAELVDGEELTREAYRELAARRYAAVGRVGRSGSVPTYPPSLEIQCEVARTHSLDWPGWRRQVLAGTRSERVEAFK